MCNLVSPKKKKKIYVLLLVFGSSVIIIKLYIFTKLDNYALKKKE